MYNKRKCNKVNDKKVLHKVRKQWVTVSLVLLMMIGSGAVATHISANADSINDQSQNINVKVPSEDTPQSKPSDQSTLNSNQIHYQISQKTITNQATQMHSQLVNQATKATLRLGSHRGRYHHQRILPSHYYRSSNKYTLQNSGFVNLKKYGHVILNKYTPNNRFAVIPKHLNVKRLTWLQGTVFHHHYNAFIYKRHGWIKANRNILRHAERALYYYKHRHSFHVSRNFVTVNHHSVPGYRNVNQLKDHHYGLYKRHVYARIDLPFWHVKANHRITVRSSVDFDRGHVVGILRTHKQVRVNRAFVEFGSHSKHLRYEISLGRHHNVFIDGHKSVLTFVLPTRRKSYYQSKLKHMLSYTHGGNLGRLSRQYRHLGHHRSLSKYVQLYVDSFNARQARQHHFVVRYHHGHRHISGNYQQTTGGGTGMTYNPSQPTNDAPQSDNSDASKMYLALNGNHEFVSLSSDGISDVENYNVNYHNNFSDILNLMVTTSSVPTAVKVINSQNVLGYQLNEISDSDAGISDQWVFSDELSNQNNMISNDSDFTSFVNTLENGYGVDATHKYFVPDSAGKDVTLGNINNDGSYSDYEQSDYQAPIFVNIINTKNLFGVNWDQISSVNSDYSGLDNRWVMSDELSTSPQTQISDTQDWNKYLDAMISAYYTPDEINQINATRLQYDYLEANENSNDINDMTTYRKHVIDWVNFYRGLYGQIPVTEDASLDKIAQASAVKDSDPEDWVSNGTINIPINPSDVGGYITEAQDIDHGTGEPGHRISLLNPRASIIGVGAYGGTETLFFDWGVNNPHYPTSSIVYPNAGIFPMDLVNQSGSDFWGYSFIINNQSSDPDYNTAYISDTPSDLSVSVFDDTDGTDVPVTDVHADTYDKSSNFSGAIFYHVDDNALKLNHEYTITIAGNGIPNGVYQYTTKLYNLADN